MGEVTSQVPYVASERIFVLLGSTHPIVAQNKICRPSLVEIKRASIY